MLNEKEKKILLRLYKYPCYAIAALGGSFLPLVPWLLYEMIEGVFVKANAGRGSIDLVFYIMIIEVCLSIIGFCYWMLYARFIRLGKRFKIIENKLNAQSNLSIDSQKVARILATGAAGRLIKKHSYGKAGKTVGRALEVGAAIESVGEASAIAFDMMRDAESFLGKCEIPIPKVSKKCMLLLFGPTILLIIISGVFIRSDLQFRHEKIAEVTGYMEELAEDFSYCEKTYGQDLEDAEFNANETYSFYAYLKDTDSHSYNPYLYLGINWEGKVQEIDYTCYIDPDKDIQEQFVNSEKDFATLMHTVAEKEIPLVSAGMKEITNYSDEFKKELQKSAFYTPMDLMAYNTDSGLRVIEHYSTETKEEYDQYTTSYVYVIIEEDKDLHR